MAESLLFSVIYSCRKATLLQEKKEAVGVSFFEQLQLSMHKLNCASCRKFFRQTQQLKVHLREAVSSMEAYPPFTFTDEQKAKLEMLLRKEREA